MTEAPGAPRGTVEPDAMARLMDLIRKVQRELDQYVRTSTLRNASASGGEGFSIITESGARRLQLLPEPGCLVAYDENEEPVLRLGTMVETGDVPGSDPYGIEVRVNGSWIQLGTQSVEWGNVGGKPAGYDPESGNWDPTAHQHPGEAITSKVAAAASADTAGSAATAGTASRADGVTPEAFGREVGGIPGTNYAVWMHSSGVLGRNTSSARYKRNVRPHDLDPETILQLQPVLYDRRATNADDFTPATSVDEFGLIAEEVHKVAPELVVWFEGQVDSVRYDLVALATLSLAKTQQARIEELESTQRAQASTIASLVAGLNQLGVTI